MEYIWESGVYALFNKVANKVYIGSAKVISRRWDEHKKYLRRNKHKNNHLQSAWNLNKEENFEFYILEFVDFENLILKEQIWLDKILEKYEVYNKNLIVSGFHGKKHSDETKRKISETKKNQNLSFKHTEESKKKISESQKKIIRKPLSEQHKKNISLNSLRIPMSEEIKQKLISMNAREYILKDPEGVIHSGNNLAEFCRSKDLDHRAIGAVLNGKRRHHKKWTLPGNSVDFEENLGYKNFSVIDPEGKIYTGKNLSEFCKLNNLNYKSMRRMLTGERSHYKNWKNNSINSK